MFKKILVPLDGSQFAESALPLALSVARRSGAALELVSVHELPPNLAYDEWEAAARDWTQSYLSETASRVEALGLGKVVTTVLSGRVSEELVKHAPRSSAELVVMATHGRGALTRAWLGSVADSFVRHTDRPVLLVRPEEEGPPPDLAQDVVLDHVLVTLDGSELSKRILDPAIRLGSLFGARYTLLRVLIFPLELASPYLPHTVTMNEDVLEEARREAMAYLEAVAADLRREGPRVDSRTEVDAQAAQAILAEAASTQADMIALATHGRGPVTRALLGSTTDKVIRGAHRPVLVVKPSGVE